MSDQAIDFVTSRELRAMVTLKDAFAFRNDRPAHWLQRLCLWTLRKLGAYHEEERLTIRRHVLRPKTFMESIFKQRSELARLLNREPTVMLIGSDDYFEMMKEPAIYHYFDFDAKYGKDRSILGLKILVIPWMKGVLVMPND